MIKPPTCSHTPKISPPNTKRASARHRFDRLPPDLARFLLFPQPDELEGVHTHTFKLKPFKKAKSCDICKQAITKEGLICKGESAAPCSTRNLCRGSCVLLLFCIPS